VGTEILDFQFWLSRFYIAARVISLQLDILGDLLSCEWTRSQDRQISQLPPDVELWLLLVYPPCCPRLGLLSSASSSRAWEMRLLMPSSQVQVQGVQVTRQEEPHHWQYPDLTMSADHSIHDSANSSFWLLLTCLPIFSTQHLSMETDSYLCVSVCMSELPSVANSFSVVTPNMESLMPTRPQYVM